MSEYSKPYEKKDGECGLWERTSKKGTKYFYGKMTWQGREYHVSIFKNSRHTGLDGDKQPFMNVILKPVE